MKNLWRRERHYVAILNMEVWLRLARLAPDVPDGWSFPDKFESNDRATYNIVRLISGDIIQKLGECYIENTLALMIIRPFQSKIVRNEHLDHVVLIAGLPIGRRWCLTAMTSVENEDGILCTDGRVTSANLTRHHFAFRCIVCPMIFSMQSIPKIKIFLGIYCWKNI